MNKYSASKIKTYESCKLKYKLNYIDNKWPKQPINDDTMFGNLVHKAFEIYDPDKDNKSEIVKLQRNYTLSRQYKSFIAGAYKSLFEFFHKYGHLPAEKELKIEMDMGSFKATGFVDRFMSGENNYLCIDYKTSRNANTDYHIFQLKFYNLVLSKKYKTQPDNIKMILYFPRPNEEKSMVFSNNQIKQFEKELNRKIIEIETNKDWSASPGFHCKWCPFYNTKDCPDTFSEKESVIS